MNTKSAIWFLSMLACVMFLFSAMISCGDDDDDDDSGDPGDDDDDDNDDNDDDNC